MARKCSFNKNIIGSVYLGSCLPSLSYFGTTITFYNKAYLNYGGSAITDVKVDPFYSINIFAEKNMDSYLLFFDKSIGRDGNHSIFTVLDVLRLPKLKQSELIIWGSCKLNGIYDSEIVAIAQREKRKELKTIYKAWRANKARGKFAQIDTNNIICAQDCGGDECSD